MKFSVRWSGEAFDDLAELWIDAAPQDRPRITAATNELDSSLGRDPEDAGESRDRGRRIVVVRPLAAIFKVEADDLSVEVLKVWRFPERRR